MVKQPMVDKCFSEAMH